METVHILWDRMYHKYTVYPKKYAHGFCFAVLCCGYTLTDFPLSIRLTSLALWQSNDCPSASKATLMNMDKYFMWIHYERLHNHNKGKHNKTVCIFLGIYCNNRAVSNKTNNAYKLYSIIHINCTVPLHYMYRPLAIDSQQHGDTFHGIDIFGPDIIITINSLGLGNSLQWVV